MVCLLITVDGKTPVICLCYLLILERSLNDRVKRFEELIVRHKSGDRERTRPRFSGTMGRSTIKAWPDNLDILRSLENNRNATIDGI
jgi:hypothetical protein